MDRLTKRIDLARRTLAHLAELTGRSSVSEVERDAAIQRFEYSFEASWHAARVVLQKLEGIEELAARIFAALDGYAGLLDRWVDAMASRARS